MNNKDKIQTFLIIGIAALMMLTATALSQDDEEIITELSEKFLSYSQVFVKFASQSVNTEIDYDAALTVSEIAKDFHLHTSYLGDFLLILKILKKHEAEKELATGLVMLRIKSVIRACEDANKRIDRAIQNVENQSIIATANDLSKDLITLQQSLEKILSKETNKE